MMEASNSQQYNTQCFKDRPELVKENKKLVARSMREWEKRLLLEKTRARAERLTKYKDENQQRLVDLAVNKQVFNVKSIRQAAIQGDCDRLVELLECGFSANSTSAMGLTPLLGACQSGCLEAVQLLLRYGADVNHQHIKTRRTALMEAVEYGSVPIVRELLRAGAKLHLRDAQDESALDCTNSSTIQRMLVAADGVWSTEVFDIFPTAHRRAANALWWMTKCQQRQFECEKREIRKEIGLIRTKLVRSSGDAKMAYDQAIKRADNQFTLVKKVEAVRIADHIYGEQQKSILDELQDALNNLRRCQQSRIVSPPIVMHILSFCGRYWFDDPPDHQLNRPVKHKETTIQPTHLQTRFHKLPAELEEEFVAIDLDLVEKCTQLLQLQEIERYDTVNCITRDPTGKSLAFIEIDVVEGEYLPYRDVRTREPIDPIVRITIRSGSATDNRVWESEPRLGDRFPKWGTTFCVDNIESVAWEVEVHMIDAKRLEIVGTTIVPLRSFLDQKEHDEWIVLPPTLRQKVLENGARLQPARLRVKCRFTHTKSILITRDIQKLFKLRSLSLQRQRNYLQTVYEDGLNNLTLL